MKPLSHALAAIATCSLALIGAAPAFAQGPPPNDNYLSSTRIPQSETKGSQVLSYSDAQDTTAATTQTDLFNPQADGLGFAGGGPEPSSCGGATYGKTIWYDLHPKIDEGVDIQASGYPNVIAVYSWSQTTSKITRRIDCGVATSGAPNDLKLRDLSKGVAYTIQIGGLQTPTGPSSGTMSFAATFFPDHDGDGVYDPLDSCAFLAGVPRFGGCPPTINPLLHYSYKSSGAGGLAINRFALASIPGGSRVKARCSCGTGQTRTAGAHATSVTLPEFVGRLLPIGSTVQIWATRARTGHGNYRYGAIGSYLKYTVTSGGLKTSLNRCLMPGSMTPRVQCPPGGRHRPT